MFSIYGNFVFMFIIDCTRDGLFHENNVKRLEELGEYLKKAFGNNPLEPAELCVDLKGEALRLVTDTFDAKNFYAFNPSFDK